MCDQGHKVTFNSQKCEIRKEGLGKLIATTVRNSSNIYELSEIGNEKCCLGKEDESWLWNRRMGHIHFDNLVKFIKREVVREVPRITKPTNTLCKHCQQGKQTKTIFKSKEYSMTRPLEIVHTDLVGPTTTKGLKGSAYNKFTFKTRSNEMDSKTTLEKLPNKKSYGKEDNTGNGRKCEALQSFWKQMLHQKRRWQNGKV
jgi:hypothetical protein